MKKTKLLMPILGVTATLGAVVPTIVACGPKEDSKIKVSITATDSVYPGDKVNIISSTVGKLVEGENFTADFVVTYKTAIGEDMVCDINNEDTEILDHEDKEISDCDLQIKENESDHTWNVSVQIPAASVDLNGIKINIGLHRGNHTAVMVSNYDYSDKLVGYDASGDPVNGIKGGKSQTFKEGGEGWDDRNPGVYFGYTLYIQVFVDMLKSKAGIDLIGKKKLVFYIYDALDDDRIDTAIWEDVVVRSGDGQTTVDVTTRRTSTSSIEITFPGAGITEAMYQGKYSITGTFWSILANMANASVCAFTSDQLEPQP